LQASVTRREPIPGGSTATIPGGRRSRSPATDPTPHDLCQRQEAQFSNPQLGWYAHSFRRRCSQSDGVGGACSVRPSSAREGARRAPQGWVHGRVWRSTLLPSRWTAYVVPRPEENSTNQSTDPGFPMESLLTARCTSCPSRIFFTGISSFLPD